MKPSRSTKANKIKIILYILYFSAQVVNNIDLSLFTRLYTFITFTESCLLFNFENLCIFNNMRIKTFA